MGSDMYMASQSYRPGPRRVRWEGGKLVIEQDYFPDGYTEVYRGSAETKEGKSILKALGVKIPPKPNTMVKYRLDFDFTKEGSKVLTLNTTHFKTPEEVEKALVLAASDDYDIDTVTMKHRRVTVLEDE